MERDAKFESVAVEAIQRYLSARILRDLFHGSFRPIFTLLNIGYKLDEITRETEINITRKLYDDINKGIQK